MQSIENGLRVRWKSAGSLNLTHQVIADNASPVWRDRVGPRALCRMLLESRECLLCEGSAANWISLIRIDGDDLQRSFRFRRRRCVCIRSSKGPNEESLRLPWFYFI